MKEDAVMERIHNVRRKMFHDSGKSIKKMFEDIKSVESKHRDMVVSSTSEKKEKKT